MQYMLAPALCTAWGMQSPCGTGCTQCRVTLHELHAAPVQGQPCTLNPGPIQIGHTDRSCMPNLVHKVSLVQMPPVAYAQSAPCATCHTWAWGWPMLHAVLRAACSTHTGPALQAGSSTWGWSMGPVQMVEQPHAPHLAHRAG